MQFYHLVYTDPQSTPGISKVQLLTQKSTDLLLERICVRKVGYRWKRRKRRKDRRREINKKRKRMIGMKPRGRTVMFLHCHSFAPIVSASM